MQVLSLSLELSQLQVVPVFIAWLTCVIATNTSGSASTSKASGVLHLVRECLTANDVPWPILIEETTLVAITFRSAQIADIPALAAMRAAEWETEAYWTRRIGEYLPEEVAQDRAILIAEDHGTPVGFVAGHRTRRFGCDGELQWVNVGRESRGRGFGAMLVRKIGSWFVDRGVRRICVDVEPDNAVARGLYSRCGAKPFKPSWMIWENARDMVDE